MDLCCLNIIGYIKGVTLSGKFQYFYLGVVEGVRRGTAVADREELLVVVVRLGADHERGEVDVLAEPLGDDELLDLLHDEARQLERAQVPRLGSYSVMSELRTHAIAPTLKLT